MNVAYITFKFPTFSETFVQREVKQLSMSNIKIDVYSIRNAEDESWNIDTNLDLGKVVNYYSLRSPKTYFKAAKRLSNDYDYLNKLLQYLSKTHKKSIPPHHLLAYLPSISCIIDEIKEKNYDHIHAHWAGLPTSVAKIASDISGIPYSISAHAQDIYTDASIDLNKKIKNSKFVVTCTEYNRNYLKNCCRESKIYRNYHGIMPEQYSCERPDNRQTQIVAGGRFVEKKGFDVLLNSLSYLEYRRDIKIPCTIFGDGPMYDNIKFKKERREMDYLKLPGKIPHHQVKKLLAEAQVFVSPSLIAENDDRDGIPNVILEAFASCTPAVGTGISGLPEVIVENETGWIIEENDEESLAQTILTAWRQPELCATYGKRGRQLVKEDFNIQKNVEELISIFENNITSRSDHRV